MKKIPSFQVDHTRLLRGVYRSRLDRIGSEACTTFDVRLKLPNREAPLSGAAAHTLEHLCATFLRNDAEWSERIIYWGPMGCLTGFYFIAAGELQPRDVLPLLTRTFQFCANFHGDIPGATPHDCGNYAFQDLDAARLEAKKFLDETLLNITEENLNYPENS